MYVVRSRSLKRVRARRERLGDENSKAHTQNLYRLNYAITAQNREVVHTQFELQIVIANFTKITNDGEGEFPVLSPKKKRSLADR